MLSGETASGEYPIEAVRMMASIADEAEQHTGDWGRCTTVSDSHDNDALALASAARELAKDRDVTAIAVFTRSGFTAQLVSKVRPHVPILAFTPDAATYRRLPLLWGVTPYLVPHADSVEAMLAHVEAAMLTASPVRRGQHVILVAGMPTGAPGPANFILLHTVGGA
jgi:pyruvate kinase